MDLNDLKRVGWFEFDTNSLGRIQCRYYSAGDARTLDKLVNENETTGLECARMLLRRIGRPAPEDENKANEESEVDDSVANFGLSKEQVDQLSDADVESFAHEFLTHNESRLVRDIEGDKSDLDSNPDNDVTRRKPGELASDYLLRVLRQYNNTTANLWSQIAKRFAGVGRLSHLSDPTVEVLRRNAELSKKLGASLDQIRKATIVPDAILQKHVQTHKPLLIPENPAHETNRRLAHLLNFANRMEPLVLESGELIRNLNDSAIRMLEDFGKSSRRSGIYNMVVITIAALTLVVTAAFSSWDLFSSQQPSKETLALISAQRSQMQELTSKFDLRTQALVDALQNSGREQSHTLADQINALKEELKRLDGDRSRAGQL